MAIFVVLIFQVLFILFAMSINVALVVHDKINLQNSLDLAAYYGAKKQAEVLNAMAHINYQMRQNWKLLAWRYRVLGVLGQDQGGRSNGPPFSCGPHPNPLTYIPVNTPYWCPQNSRCDTDCTTNNLTPSSGTLAMCNAARAKLLARRPPVNQGSYCDKDYFVCISNDFWKRGVNKGVNLCRTSGNYPPPIQSLPPVSRHTLSFFNIVRNLSADLQQKVTSSCTMEGSLNWLMAQIFLTHFRLDQRDRKTMMREIYNRTLKVGRDLDKKPIFDGAEKVFWHNLNQSNKRNFRTPSSALEQFNSFNKSGRQGAGLEFKDVFDYVHTFPVLLYLDVARGNNNNCSGGAGSCNAEIKPHYEYHRRNINTFFRDAIVPLSDSCGSCNPPLSCVHKLHPPLTGSAEARVKNLFKFNGPSPLPWDPTEPIANLTLSFIKKPEKVLYYGLKVNFRANPRFQVFSLSLNPGIEFRASSFAKPFGGRFGPTKDQSDPLIPIKTRGKNELPVPPNPPNPFFLQPNHSRWPGDQWGLLDRDIHRQDGDYYFLKKSYDIDEELEKRLGDNRYNGTFHYNMEDFWHLILYDTVGDPLARPIERYTSNTIHPMSFIRLMELMAVYPDFYDLSYYSISANYMETYFPKICRLLMGGRDCQYNNPSAGHKIQGAGNVAAYIRGDFGWPEGKDSYWNTRRHNYLDTDLSIAPYFLKDRQDPFLIKTAGIRTKINDRDDRTSPYLPVADLTSRRIFYKWLAKELPGDLLSSWAPTQKPERYAEYDFPEYSFLQCRHKASPGKHVPSSCAVGGRSGYSVKLISCETVKSFANMLPPDIDEYCPP